MPICSRSRRNGAGAARITSAPRSTGSAISTRSRDEIEAILREVYGSDTALMDAALALVLPRHLGPVRLRRRQRMGRQPLPDAGGIDSSRVRSGLTTGTARSCCRAIETRATKRTHCILARRGNSFDTIFSVLDFSAGRAFDRSQRCLSFGTTGTRPWPRWKRLPQSSFLSWWCWRYCASARPAAIKRVRQEIDLESRQTGHLEVCSVNQQRGLD